MCRKCDLFDGAVSMAAEAATAPPEAIRGFLFDIAGDLGQMGDDMSPVAAGVHRLAHGVRHGRFEARHALSIASGMLLCVALLSGAGEA